MAARTPPSSLASATATTPPTSASSSRPSTPRPPWASPQRIVLSAYPGDFGADRVNDEYDTESQYLVSGARVVIRANDSKARHRHLSISLRTCFKGRNPRQD